MPVFNNALDRLRQPEYTGKNRCLPCTIVNALIAVGLALGLGLLWLPAGLVGLVVSAGVIYFRGYLVPGTPELTQRYFPVWLLDLFGKEPAHSAESITGPSGGGVQQSLGEIEQQLQSASVVEECAEEDDVCLTDEFREDWWRRIRRFRDDENAAASQLATTADLDPDALAFVAENGRFGVTYEGDYIARWASDAAFYADLAAEPTLAERFPEWEELGDRQRTELLAGMRAFLAQCPACDAALDQVENVRQSCCAGEMVSIAVDCSDCGARVFDGSYT